MPQVTFLERLQKQQFLRKGHRRGSTVSWSEYSDNQLHPLLISSVCQIQLSSLLLPRVKGRQQRALRPDANALTFSDYIALLRAYSANTLYRYRPFTAAFHPNSFKVMICNILVNISLFQIVPSL